MSYPPAFAALEAEITPLTTPYSAGQVIGGLLALGPVHGYTGLLIKSITVLDDDNKGAALDVHVFDQPPAAFPDQAAFSPGYADLKKRLARIPFSTGDYEALNGSKIAVFDDVNLVLPASGCWIYLAAAGAVTFSAGRKIYLRVFVLG
jgi:hypothetical protein